MDVEAFIRESAKLGWSKTMTAQALDISFNKLSTICSSIKGLKWKPSHKSPVREEFNRAMQGHMSEARRVALEAARARWQAASAHHQIGSTRATTSMQVEFWKEYVDVNIATVNRRLAAGYSVLDAFFLPPLPRDKRRRAKWVKPCTA